MSDTAACPCRSSGTKPAPSRRRSLMPRRPAKADRVAVGHGILAGQRIEQFALPVSGDAGHGEHLARANGEVDVLERDREGSAGRNGEIADLDANIPRGLAPLPLNARNIGADHHSRKRSGGLLLRVAVTRHASVTQHGRAVADALHFFQPMADVEHGPPLCLQLEQRLEQPVRLLGCEDRGGFIQDDELRVLQEGADDLDALAFADGKVRDMRIGIERQAVGLRQCRGFFGNLRERDAGVERQRDIFRHRQCLEQREVLEDHSDAERPGLAWRAYGHRLAVPEDLPFGRIEDAEQHLNEGGLAGTVLPEKGMDFAGTDIQVDPGAGGEIAEMLGQISDRQ